MYSDPNGYLLIGGKFNGVGGTATQSLIIVQSFN